MSSSLVSQTGKSMERRQGITLTPRLGLAWWRDSTSSRNGRDASGEAVERDQGKTCELLTGIPELNENKASASTAQQWDAKPIEINGQDEIVPITFLAHGDYIIGGDGNKIRRWRVKDGKEVGQPMDAGSVVRSIATSRDGKWIVGGTLSHHVMVWDAESHQKVHQFNSWGDTWAVDISPDATRIATGSHDRAACVWSLSTGQQLLDPFKHDRQVAAVKFSPDGGLIATATWERESVRVYDTHNGRLLVDTPIQVSSPRNQSLAWINDSKQLFILSRDGNIHCLDVATGQVLFRWTIHSDGFRGCIALAGDSSFIAASAYSSVSFWDIITHEQIGPLIDHPTHVFFMDISANHDLMIGGGKKINLRKLPDILPSSFFDRVSLFSSKIRS